MISAALAAELLHLSEREMVAAAPEPEVDPPSKVARADRDDFPQPGPALQPQPFPEHHWLPRLSSLNTGLLILGWFIIMLNFILAKIWFTRCNCVLFSFYSCSFVLSLSLPFVSWLSIFIFDPSYLFSSSRRQCTLSAPSLPPKSRSASLPP